MFAASDTRSNVYVYCDLAFHMWLCCVVSRCPNVGLGEEISLFPGGAVEIVWIGG